MIYVETARSGDVGPHVPDIGMPISVVMTAMGRAAAATLPQADAALLEERIASEDTELWSAFRETYRAGLAQCASRGFCTCYGEYIASIHAVAAPLFHAGEAKQAFSINCGIPAFRLQPGQLEGEIGPRIAALRRQHPRHGRNGAATKHKSKTEKKRQTMNNDNRRSATGRPS